MGVEQHHAVLATTWNDNCAGAVRNWIEDVGLVNPEGASRFLFGEQTQTNGYTTIVLVPDGSYEGWPESDAGNELRKQFIARLHEDDYDEDGSSPWDIVEVTWGDRGSRIVSGNRLEDVEL